MANTKSIANKPKKSSHVEPSTLPFVGVSAWQAVSEKYSIIKGSKDSNRGGVGHIGSIAVQLAMHLGAHLATTVGTNYK